MTTLTDYVVADRLISQLEQRHIDITQNYDTWIEIGASLSTLGEQGRQLFHRISKINPGYNARQCDYKYNSILRWHHNYTLGTLIHLCRQASVNVPSGCRQLPRIKPSSPITSRIAMPAITHIDNSIVEPTLANHSHNQLFNFMTSLYGIDTVSHVWQQYRVGTNPQGETIFWQHDNRALCRSGKIMAYDNKGHRRRDLHVDWAHSRLKIKDFVLDQVFFGLHLIDRHCGWVSIVESEKTALIAMCHVNPTCHPEGELFLATGGSHNLKEDKLKPIGYRPLRLYPDRDCQEQWSKWACEIQISVPQFEIMVLPDDSNHLGPKADYADLLIDWQQKKLYPQDCDK